MKVMGSVPSWVRIDVGLNPPTRLSVPHTVVNQEVVPMQEPGERAAWRAGWTAVVASDVSRDGLGWGFESPAGEVVWQVGRDDSGASPVFRATRHGALPHLAVLRSMTREAVGDLLTAAGLADPAGWLAANIAEALLFASREIIGWEGEEWAVDSDPASGEALAWAEPEARRVPFSWLLVRCGEESRAIDIYQDNAAYGLDFRSSRVPDLRPAIGSHRPRSGMPMPRGQVRSVEVLCDTIDPGAARAGVVSEVALHLDDETVHLIAAMAHGEDEWHRSGDSVVWLRGPDVSDSLGWIPPRTQVFPLTRR